MAYTDLAYQRAVEVPVPPPYQVTDAEQWLINHVNETFDEPSNPIINLLHDEWYECILYYLGEQWIQYEKIGAFRRINKEDWIPTPVDNHIVDTVEVAVSNMLSAKFIPRVIPNSNDPKDVYGARLGDRVMVQLDNETEFEDEKDWAYWWAAVCGTGFLMAEAKDLANRAIVLEPSPVEGEDEDEEKAPGVIPDKVVDRRHLNPFWVRVSELATDLKVGRCEWWGYQEIKSLDWVRENFPDKAKYVQADSIEGTSVRYQAKLWELVGHASTRVFSSSFGTRGSLYGTLDRHTIVKYKEWGPTRDYPRGRCAVVASNILLYDGPLPISDEEGIAEYSAVALHYRRVPGRFWSKGVVRDILSPQDRINGIDAQIVLNRKHCINPQKLIPLGCGIKVWSGEPGRNVVWDPTQTMGHKPEIIQGQGLPNDVWNERIGMADSIKRSSGSEDILKGKAPQGVRAGIALDMLEEKAASRHYHRDNRMKTALQRLYRLCLILVQKHYTIPKLIKIGGQQDVYDVKQFTAAELRSNNDVRLESDSGISRTAAGRTYMLMQMAANGLVDVTNPVERSEILRRLGLSGFKTQISQDYERAERENAEMTSGQGKLFEKVSVFGLDDHSIHIAVHTNRMKQSDFLELPEAIQGEMVSHVGAHIEKMLEQPPAPVEMPPAGGGGGGPARSVGSIGGEGAL